MQQQRGVETKQRGNGASGGGWLEAAVLIPNLVLVALVVLFMIATQAGGRAVVAPLVKGERGTELRIAQLERRLGRFPSDIQGAVELAQLYQEVGEFPWSVDALREAERHGGTEPRWRLSLGLAYLELGKNRDAKRVLRRALKQCETEASASTCSANVRVKLRLFNTLADRFIQRGIDSRRHHEAADKALREILKPVEVDPDKLRPKAPADPRDKSPASQPASPAPAGRG